MALLTNIGSIGMIWIWSRRALQAKFFGAGHQKQGNRYAHFLSVFDFQKELMQLFDATFSRNYQIDKIKQKYR